MRKLVMFVIAVFAVSACNTPPVKEVVYVEVTDTVIDKSSELKIVELQEQIDFVKDSLTSINDSLNKELFIANYKLARVKRYNDIAAKGNNIKYLRGWIRRALEE